MPNTSYTFADCYKLLGVPPNISWIELKRAYKKNLQKLHPDKVQYNNIDATKAAEQFKVIQKAFTILEAHYLTYETLPNIQPVPVQAEMLQRKNENDTIISKTHKIAQKEPSQKTIRLFPSLILAVAVGTIMYYFFVVDSESNDYYNSITAAPSVNKPITPGANQARLDGTNAIEKKPFSFGSTKIDVIETQGFPTQLGENIWYYGSSHVIFKNDLVNDWFQHESSPLNVSLTPQVPNITNTEDLYATTRHLNIIKKGATKADVRLIQGEPMQDLIDVWVYGTSKIYFKDDHVVSWINSQRDPIKVE